MSNSLLFFVSKGGVNFFTPPFLLCDIINCTFMFR